MNALKSAIVGLALILMNSPAGADVITDWNQTRNGRHEGG